MKELPIWLLDVDGVINTYGGGARPPHSWPKSDWIITRISSQNVWVSKTVVDFIRSVHDQGEAEIRWHTSWQGHAYYLAEELGLPYFPVQFAPELGSYTEDAQGWWKVPPIQRLLDEGRKVLWTDDDANALSVRELSALQAMGPVEVIAPSYQTGLCRRHLRQITTILKDFGS